MKTIFLQVLDYERDLVHRTRAEGVILIRPSTLILVLFFILYAVSPIDIIPEKWVKPFIFGIVDDIILFAVTVIYTYRDWGELFDAEIPTFNLRRTKHDGESEVSMDDGSEESDDSRVTSNSRIDRDIDDSIEVDGDRSSSDNGATVGSSSDIPTTEGVIGSSENGDDNDNDSDGNNSGNSGDGGKGGWDVFFP